MLRPYLELKLSWEMFQKAPDALNEPERSRLSQIAVRQDAIEQRILATPEAAHVVVPDETLATRLGEVRGRYPADDDFQADLLRLGISESELEQAIERDLRVESVLERVAASAPPVSSVDAEIYYRLHPDAFDRPEARRLRHILMTFDSAKEREKTVKTLENLRSTATSAEKFADAALRHSQCPTAMEGGILGIVKRQQLYTELEPAAFALQEGEISAVLESPIGLHIIRCDEIFPSGPLPFKEVCDKIIERLGDKRRREAQRDWIKTLGKAR